MLLIDGSYKHGGGSILRLASGFSVLTQKSIKVINIRADRPDPGLKQQHLQGLRAISSICNGKLINDKINSMEIEFCPGSIERDFVEINVPTAGSIGLILQPIILAAIFAKQKIKIKINGGATVGKWAPPIYFLQNVTLELLKKIGYEIDIKILKHGFYPKGGAKVEAEINPTKKLKPLKLEEQGEIKKINGISMASSYLEKSVVAERQKNVAEFELKKFFDKELISIKTEYIKTESPGSCIVLWLETENCILGSDAIGEMNVKAEMLGKNAAQDLIECYQLGATVDKYTADQIIPFLGLTKNSTIKIQKITGHIETALWLSELFLEMKFDIIKNNCVVIKD